MKALKKALELNPESVRLWKEVVAVSTESEAKKYLEKAVICAPHSLELWLALAKLLPYKEARRILNNARKQLPLEAAIWISAAKLEEAEGQLCNVNEVIKRGIKTLVNSGVEIIRDNWIQEAVHAEKAQSVSTAKSIISNCMHLGLEATQKVSAWIKDIITFQQEKCIESARHLYNLALECCPTTKALWKAAYTFELQINDRASYHFYARLAKTVQIPRNY